MADKEPANEQVVATIYGSLRTELNQVYSKIAIQPLDPSRRCYRIIGGVLVERTVTEILPAVLRYKEGLEEVIARLNMSLENKKKEIADFETKYKIRISKFDGKVTDDGGRKEGSSQGVLAGRAS